MLRGYRFLIAAACGIAIIAVLGTGAFFGSLYSPGHKEYQAESGEQSGQSDYTGPSRSLPDISGLPGPFERAIANPHPSTGADHEKRDLAAQEASALWAFWMVFATIASVLITATGTVLLFKQIVLTREAVKDTSEATAAMIRQNALTEEAQRPWIIVRCRLLSFRRDDHNLSMTYVVEFENVGKTVARDFWYTSSFDAMDPISERNIARVNHRFKQIRSKRDGASSVLIPGETAQYKALTNFSFRNSPGQAKPVSAIISAAAHYRENHGGPWRETEVSFVVVGPSDFDGCIRPTMSSGVDALSIVHVLRYVTGTVS